LNTVVGAPKVGIYSAVPKTNVQTHSAPSALSGIWAVKLCQKLKNVTLGSVLSAI